jgi:tetratricopeptide (TPR) repeat protein
MRQQFLVDHSGPAHARHTLILPGDPAGAGPAGGEAELLSLRLGLPTHARVGALGFQPRAITVAGVGQSLDAATYLEALVSQNRGSGRVCAVHGRAGCGKSALASAVVSRLQQQCSSTAVVWLDASNLTTICSGIMTLAKTLLGLGRRGGLDRQPHQQIGALQVVSAWLREERNWLLVLDDVRNVAEIEELRIPLGNGMVLLTTRLPLDTLKARFEGCTGVELGPFRPEEALSCVRRATGATDRDAMALCERVQHFPITIAHAAAHLLQRKVSVSQFIADLNRKLALEVKTAAQRPLEARGALFPPCFLVLLEMRINELRSQQSDSTLRLIFLLSFLNSRGIRYKMISTELLPRAQESIALLFHQKLICEDQEGLIHVHQLVQDAVREIIADLSDSLEIRGGCCMTSTCCPGPAANLTLATSSESLALACRLVVEEMTSCDRDKIELAAPHALKLVGHNGKDLELLRITAEFLSAIQKDFTKSLELRHCMLRVQTASGDSADPMAVCATFVGIAKIHELLGQHSDAICAHEEVVRVLKKFRRDPLRMAETLDSIGMIFYRTRRFKGALLRFEESLAVKESLPEAEADPEIVSTLEKIADSYCAQGYYEVALEKWHRVLQILKGIPEGSAHNHKEIARVLNTMGLIHADLQRYDEALRFYHDSLKALKHSPDDVGMYEARIHISIAKCHQSLGRYDDAVINYDRALSFQRQLCFGREELCISQTLDEMAYAFSVSGDYNTAVSSLRESVAIKLKNLEPNDLKLARGKMELVMQLKYLGIKSDSGNSNIVEALDLITSVRATYEHVLGSADALTVQAAAVQSELLAASRSAADLSMAISLQSLSINMTPRSERKPRASPRTPRFSASPRTPSSPPVQGKMSSPQSPSLNIVLRSVDVQRRLSDLHGAQQLPPISPQQRQESLQDVF